MGQNEYTVGLASKPDEMGRVALAFKAGEQKERDRILNQLTKMSNTGTSTSGLGSLVWTLPLIERLNLK